MREFVLDESQNDELVLLFLDPIVCPDAIVKPTAGVISHTLLVRFEHSPNRFTVFKIGLLFTKVTGILTQVFLVEEVISGCGFPDTLILDMFPIVIEQGFDAS